MEKTREKNKRGKKVLIVEDEQILMEMYKDKLEDSGFDVICASEAETGLEIAKKEKPDLVLLDILLPKANGVYFLTQLRKDPEIKSTPVLIFSNYDDPDTKLKSTKLGIEEYLIKANYTPGEIIDKITTYLEIKSTLKK